MNKLIWYDKYKGLQGNILSKAKKFNQLKLIKYQGINRWAVNHIEGYNKTDYDVILNPNGAFSCNCQYFSKKGEKCSHILAVELFLEINNGN